MKRTSIATTEFSNRKKISNVQFNLCEVEIFR